MLVLTRFNDQSIVIGDDIIVTVIESRAGKTRLGITAPRHVPVDRAEIREAKDREREQQDFGGPVS